jgi:hypothetical protein
MGARDALNDGLQYNGETDAKIEIVLGTKPGSLSGSVVAVINEKQLPAINTTVVLVPDPSRRRRSDAYRTVTSDISGRFQIPRIPPGDYTVLAWEDAWAAHRQAGSSCAFTKIEE